MFDAPISALNFDQQERTRRFTDYRKEDDSVIPAFSDIQSIALPTLKHQVMYAPVTLLSAEELVV